MKGMAFCYFFVFGMVFRFIASFAPESITQMPDIEQYLSFVIGMFIAFGVTFEVPVVVILLAKIGVVTVEKLREARPYVIVGAFVVAAVVTPPDVVSQFMLAVPMIILYEVGILISARMLKPAAPGTDLVTSGRDSAFDQSVNDLAEQEKSAGDHKSPSA